MTEGLRAVIMLFTCIPKVLIAVWISWLGAKFLVLGKNNGHVILKALALQYFVGIDEILYKSLVAEGRQLKVQEPVI